MKRTVNCSIPNFEYHEYPEWYYEDKAKCTREKKCHYCGGELPEGKRTYCSIECKMNYNNWAGIVSLRTNSMRREVHKKFHFACTNCGEIFFSELKSGIRIPRFWGEAHHIIPLENGGIDDFKNLTLLCKDCHKLAHKQIH
jgi:5-methylcytosine-specific restriction endonuclease McrA